MKNKKEKTFGFKFFKAILGPLFLLLYRPKIIGKEKIPKTGPVLLCSNHMHVLDQCLAILATKRVAHYMAKKEYFDGKGAWFFKCTGCIPVNRQIKDTDAKQRAINVLNDGGVIGIFPEGTRNKTDAILLPFKFGAISMAQKTHATIVPAAVCGEYKAKKNNNLMIRFGEPFTVPEDADLTEVNEKFMQTIKDLMKQNEEYIKNKTNK